MRIVIVIALVLVLGVGGFVAIKAATSGGADTNESSGEVLKPRGKRYSVEIPKGTVKVPPRKDRSIPSTTDLSLELEGKPQAGGLIKTGTLAGPAASGTFKEVGQEAARQYSDQYEAHPDQWGQGAKVESKTVKLDGRDAVEIRTQFSPSGNAAPSVFFRIYFVDPPAGAPILITCDWNTIDTEDIAAACDTVVDSFRVTT